VHSAVLNATVAVNCCNDVSDMASKDRLSSQWFWRSVGTQHKAVACEAPGVPIDTRIDCSSPTSSPT
jgi:hypothetical protein